MSWREAGQQKAETVVKVARGIEVTSAIEIGCGPGAVLKRLQRLKFANHFACVDLSHSPVTFVRNMSNASVASATQDWGLRQALKALLPAAVYARVLTSHSTSLCKRAGI